MASSLENKEEGALLCEASETLLSNLTQAAESDAKSAAAKKKQKKKEREKRKKAEASASVSAAVAEEREGKVPLHVRRMQEELARREEEAAERKRRELEREREEQEALRKEEERIRKKEEERRAKKEREKEKKERKRASGLTLTAKQKEEKHRLEIMRNQLLGSSASKLPGSDDDDAPRKRPVYATKKSKLSRGGGIGSAMDDEGSKDVIAVSVPDGDDVAVSVPDKVGVSDNREEAGSAAQLTVQVADNWEDIAAAEQEADSVVQLAVKAEAEQAAEAVIRDAALPSSDVSSEGNCLRSPICCIMGHVDAGKTKLLDCIRGTKVQEGEAGGITQQIGATFIPAQNIRERTNAVKTDAVVDVPGLLVIDTPGHECFANLRSRGSGLCNIAILVVDIARGLEPQTIDSLNLLKMRDTLFIVALNKVDRLYGWRTCRDSPILQAIKQQSRDVVIEFDTKVKNIMTQFLEQGFNTELYRSKEFVSLFKEKGLNTALYRNKKVGDTFISIVPTSAVTGEGVPDLLLLSVKWTQKAMIEKLRFSSKVECSVMEVKVVKGHGTTLDVVLVNGVLREGDQIVCCDLHGNAIVTNIRSLLTPNPMTELRVERMYLHHKEIKAAQVIKVAASGLEHAIAGTSLYVVRPEDDLEVIKGLAMEDMSSLTSMIDKRKPGVCVHASDLGSLEGFLQLLKSETPSIPVRHMSLGPVHRNDVVRASGMLEKKKEYASILAFNVAVMPQASKYAKQVGVEICESNTIYKLRDQFKSYLDNTREEKKREAAPNAVFPCILKIKQKIKVSKKGVIILGVDVVRGIAKVGTPLAIFISGNECRPVGQIASIQHDHKTLDSATKGQEVGISIVCQNPEEQRWCCGCKENVQLVSVISSESFGIIEEYFSDDEAFTAEVKDLHKKLLRKFSLCGTSWW